MRRLLALLVIFGGAPAAAQDEHVQIAKRVLSGVPLFDGIDRRPVGLEDVSTYPALFAELSRRGRTESELRQLAADSMLRVMRRAETVARRLRAERGPSTATIEELDGLVP